MDSTVGMVRPGSKDRTMINLKGKLGLAKDVDFNVDMDALWAHEALRRPAFELGVSNMIKDSHASITHKDNGGNAFALKLEQATKKYESLLRGELELAGVGGRATDPVAKAAKGIATTRVQKHINGDATKLAAWAAAHDPQLPCATDDEKKIALARWIWEESQLPKVQDAAKRIAEVAALAMDDLDEAA